MTAPSQRHTMTSEFFVSPSRTVDFFESFYWWTPSSIGFVPVKCVVYMTVDISFHVGTRSVKTFLLNSTWNGPRKPSLAMVFLTLSDDSTECFLWSGGARLSESTDSSIAKAVVRSNVRFNKRS